MLPGQADILDQLRQDLRQAVLSGRGGTVVERIPVELRVRETCCPPKTVTTNDTNEDE